MDITATENLGTLNTAANDTVNYPYKCLHSFGAKPLVKHLNGYRMLRNLKKLCSFHTRYYDSYHGQKSSEWVLKRLNRLIKRAHVQDFVTAKRFDHPWKQSSIIARIAGQSQTTIIIGAHLDSINLWLPTLAAPGADAGGSGTVTIMEAFNALLWSRSLREKKAVNTIEFHWYSAGEGGLLGSQAVFKEYEKRHRDVKAMLQQDMTGYVRGTLDAGLADRLGVVVDNVDPGLTAFIKTVIEQVRQGSVKHPSNIRQKSVKHPSMIGGNV